MTLEQIEDAVKKIAEILIRQYGRFVTDCGADFNGGEGCESCTYYSRCKKGTDLESLTGELSSIIEGE